MSINIKYKIKNSSKARHLRLALYPDKRIVITKPIFCSQKMVDKFLAAKKDWLLKKIKEIESLPAKKQYPKDHYKKNKELARKIVKEKLEKYNQYYQFKYKRISIRAQKTRWGSCSNNSNLNFNYKLILLSEPLQDYIVIHELCHLKEMNHSSKFWNLVAQTCPDYKAYRKELKKINI